MSELNDYVRDDLIGALAPEQVAEIATQLDTDDAVAIIEDMEEDEQQAVLEALHPEDRAAIEDAQIGRASCREGVCSEVLCSVVAGAFKKKINKYISQNI